MKTAILFAVVAVAFATPVAAQDYRGLFETLDQAVRERFYDPHFGGRDWNAISARYRERMAMARSDDEFRQLGKAMLGELGVSHVALRSPGQSGPSLGLAALTDDIDGRTVVIDIDPASAAREAGLRIGDTILDPDAIRGPKQAPAQFDVERCDGSRARLAVPREAAYWPPRERTIGWSVLRRGDGRSVGYLRVERFGDDAAPLVDEAMATLGRTDGLLIDLRRNSGGNASALRLLSYFGRPGPAIALLSREFLAGLDGPVEAGDLSGIARVTGAYSTEAVFEAVEKGHGAVMLMVEDLGQHRYAGPVVVLVGPETASAAEGFAWGVRDRSDAVLVGRATAGALLSSERIDLPGGWSVTLPVHGTWSADGRDYRDRPVPPHVVTVHTRETICRQEDVDLAAGVRALEAAWVRLRP